MIRNFVRRSVGFSPPIIFPHPISKNDVSSIMTPCRHAASESIHVSVPTNDLLDEKHHQHKKDSSVSSRSLDSRTKGPGILKFDDHVLGTVESVVKARWTCRNFDETRLVDPDLITRILDSTIRAPTGFNLQPWHAIVVQDPERRKALCAAALNQPQVQQAPLTVVFVGDMEAERNAPQALEIGLENSYITQSYAPLFLRNVYYFLHGGPFRVMAFTKSVLSSCYSRTTGTPLLSVPISMKSYAWKQAMIPATTFVHLCTAAGLNTCIMEGMDEEAVKKVTGLSSRYTVPVIVSVGYARLSSDGEKDELNHSESTQEKKLVWSPRFSAKHIIRWETF